MSVQMTIALKPVLQNRTKIKIDKKYKNEGTQNIHIDSTCIHQPNINDLKADNRQYIIVQFCLGATDR